MRKSVFALLFLFAAAPALAADYVIDTEGAHAAVQFRIKHLGYSWLTGRFNDFAGTFSYDEEKPSAAQVDVTIQAASIDSNHAERDKHLRGSDFFDVKKYPTARFVSTSFEAREDGSGLLRGELTLRGVTRPITIDVEPIGAGPDPWGGYRRGFAGTTRLTLKDFGFDYNLGPDAREAELALYVEGIRQ